MLKILIILVLALSAMVTPAFTPISADSQNTTNLLMITKIGAQATNLGGNCFFPIIIKLNLTWIASNTLYVISTSNFWLVITTKNVIVTNSTNISYQNPNNLIPQIQLFPNLPVILYLSFSKTCLPAGVSNVQLIYLDGTYNFTFGLP